MKRANKRGLAIILAGLITLSLLGNGMTAQAEQKDSVSESSEVLLTISGNDVSMLGDEADEEEPGATEQDAPAEPLDYILGRPMTEEEEQAQEELYNYYHQFTGGIVLPEDLPGDNTLPAAMLSVRGNLPGKFDTRNVNGVNYIPAIRNQESYGTCWCFASLACLEINLIKKGLADTGIDLSEKHLAFFSYYSAPDPLDNDGDAKSYFNSDRAGGNQYYAVGGNMAMTSNALMSWKGAVKESLVTDSMVMAGLDAEDTELAYGNDIYYMSNSYMLPTGDRDGIKAAILQYGGVGIMYNSSSQYYKYSTAAQYCNVENTGVDHGVAIVGWDDSYSKYNFRTTPASDGAWLVRNSWGSGWGDEGYFWLSYEDKSIYKTAYVFEGILTEGYDNNYQYDHSTSYQYVTANHAANVFTASGNGDKAEVLNAVGIHLGNAGISYSVQIYTNLTDPADPTSGIAALDIPQKGTTSYAGYYMIPLNKSIMLEPGDTFSVVFDLSKDSENSWVGIESSANDIRYSETTAEAGESFLLYNGYGWTDWGERQNANLKIKAYTKDTNVEIIQCKGITMQGESSVIKVNESTRCTVTFNPSNTTNKELTWSSSDPTVARVSNEGIITGVKAGTATITATTVKGGYSADWTITVVQPVTKVVFSYNTDVFYTGEKYAATVEVGPADATDKSLTWSSSDKKVAEVDNQGSITVKTAGTTKITATAKSGVNYSQTIQTTEDLVRDFVKRMYTVALSRDAESEGIEYWVNRLKDQEIDGAGISYGFICSDEFKNRRLSDRAYVEVLYRTFFNREAEEDGRTYWMEKLSAGQSREYVLSGFVNSREFSELCDSYGIARGTMQEDGSSIYRPGVRAFVLRLYTKVLNRQGETMGVEDWTNWINTGEITAENAAKRFFASDEFINRKLNDADYVEVLYETFMDRASEPGGKAYWLVKLQTGMSREQVLEGFSQSEEFKGIMASYGL